MDRRCAVDAEFQHALRESGGDSAPSGRRETWPTLSVCSWPRFRLQCNEPSQCRAGRMTRRAPLAATSYRTRSDRGPVLLAGAVCGRPMACGRDAKEGDDGAERRERLELGGRGTSGAAGASGGEWRGDRRGRLDGRRGRSGCELASGDAGAARTGGGPAPVAGQGPGAGQEARPRIPRPVPRMAMRRTSRPSTRAIRPRCARRAPSPS